MIKINYIKNKYQPKIMTIKTNKWFFFDMVSKDLYFNKKLLIEKCTNPKYLHVIISSPFSKNTIKNYVHLERSTTSIELASFEYFKEANINKK